MNEERAREILGDAIYPKGLGVAGEYLEWEYGDDEACLDGHFTVDELEAIAWWMRNKGGSK